MPSCQQAPRVPFHIRGGANSVWNFMNYIFELMQGDTTNVWQFNCCLISKAGCQKSEKTDSRRSCLVFRPHTCYDELYASRVHTQVCQKERQRNVAPTQARRQIRARFIYSSTLPNVISTSLNWTPTHVGDFDLDGCGSTWCNSCPSSNVIKKKNRWPQASWLKPKTPAFRTGAYAGGDGQVTRFCNVL